MKDFVSDVLDLLFPVFACISLVLAIIAYKFKNIKVQSDACVAACDKIEVDHMNQSADIRCELTCVKSALNSLLK